MKHFTAMAAALCFLLLTPGAMPAHAQSVAPPTQSEIETYAAAVVSAQSVAEQYQSKAQTAGSQAELDQLRAGYVDALREAVVNEGISVKRYNEIYQATEQDPELAEAVNDAINDERS